jgi:acid phosphatase (class A)
MKRFLKIALVLSIALSFAAGVMYAKGKTYVAPADIDLTKLLPPPPAQKSAQTEKEINEILDFQKNRTKEMIDYAVADQTISVFRFSDILGENFIKEKLPFTAEFFANVTNTASDVVSPAKDFWNRPRPSAWDSRVKPCVKVPTNAAYPSGHSTAGNLMAIILANMLPEKSAEIFNRGWAFAVNRIIGGVHYRSDSEAGRIAATLIAADMFKNSDFKADFEKSKAEVRKALGYDKEPVAVGTAAK